MLTAIRTVKIIQDNHLRDLLPVLGIILGDEPGCPEAELPLDVEPGPIVDGGPKLGGFDADATYPEVETLLEIDVEPPTDDGGVSPELSFSDAWVLRDEVLLLELCREPCGFAVGNLTAELRVLVLAYFVHFKKEVRRKSTRICER